jgi:Spy/CpxP family protein refolding chaperone
MYHIAKVFICCIMFLKIILGTGVCSAHIDVSDMYQEALWVNLNLSKEQKERIDGIILEADRQVKAVQRKQEIGNLYEINDLYNYADSLSQMKEIRMEANTKIMQLLPPNQRAIFEDQTEESQRLTDKYMMMILNLDLTESQQTAIISSLIKSQQRVWSIVSNSSLSWEQRRKKLKSVNAIELISNQLTKTQRNTWKEWSKSYNLINF